MSAQPVTPVPDIHLLAVAVTTVVAFVGSGTYYTILSGPLATVSPSSEERPQTWTFAVELLRSLVVVVVVAALVSRTRTDTLAGGLLLGLALWIGFPLMLWIGATFHERTPVKLAVIHAGDWLIKLVATTVILTVWS